MKNLATSFAQRIFVSVIFFFCLAGLIFQKASAHEVEVANADTVPLKHILNQIMNPKALNAVCSTCRPVAQNTSLQFGKDPLRFDTTELCSNSEGKCKKISYFDICGQVEEKISTYDAAGNFPNEANHRQQHSRFNSPRLRKKIFAYTYNEFKRILEDKALQDRCCRGGQTCANHLKKTELYLLKGLPVSDGSAYYNHKSKPPGIEVSEAVLLKCKTHDCIRQTLMHEYAHACQYARSDFSTDVNYCAPAEKLMLENLNSDFGASSAECFKSRLSEAENSSKRSPAKACLGVWLSEAHADALFLDRWKNPSAFSAVCWKNKYAGDGLHGPSNVLECVMKQTPFRKSMCGSEESCIP